MDTSIRIALLDADPDVRFGRRMLLESHPSIQVVFESDGNAADLEQIAQGLIDVLVIDQRLAAGEGVRFYKLLGNLIGLKNAPNAVITAAFNQPALSLAAVEAGVFEVVELERGPEELLSAVTRAAAGSSEQSLDVLFELIASQKISAELDLEFIGLVRELPERLASNLRRLRQLWKKADPEKLALFDSAGMANLVERLPVRSLSQLIVKLHRSELMDVE
jgi:DNA-binding NarL/FixJ family response regulator